MQHGGRLNGVFRIVVEGVGFMKLSLIIAVYQRDDFLRLVLESVRRQKFRDFEVIVAEDGDSGDVARVVEAFRDRNEIPLTHLFQEDDGFRKARILNRAVDVAKGEFLVFIDGDCLLHHLFLYKYAERAQDGLCLFGRRVMVGRRLTDCLLREGEGYNINFFRVLFSQSRKKEEALYLSFLGTWRKSGVLGCSFCVSRHDMRAINGFDEDFTQPFYGEDTDVERRLRLLGLRIVCTRYATIQYHLHHDAGDRKLSWAISEDLFNRKSEKGLFWCSNGIVKSET